MNVQASQDAPAGPAQVESSGKKLIALSFTLTAVQLVFLLAAAGTWKWPNAWMYWLTVLTFQSIAIPTLARRNPDLLNRRGKAFRPDTKFFDRIILRLYLPLTLAGLVVAGVDAGRLEWSSIPFSVSAIALAAMTLLGGIAWWAMFTNPHFESTVRIQTDRGHRVVSAGPYRYIRHPGYFGSISAALLLPIVLGSWLAYGAFGPAAALMALRTALEDHTLHRELEGYSDYAGRVRYRLVPGLW